MAKHPRKMAPKPENSVFSRKFRAFLRWMRDNGIEYSDALDFELRWSGSVADIGVKALVDMEEGDLIAAIPKQACLTTLTTAASSMLEEAEIGGALGLAVALMYERSLQERSKWYGYLQLLPNAGKLPFLWTPEEIDELLAGTELHQAIKEERVLMEEDWKESIAPLTELNPEEFPAEWFTLDRYLAAKTLVNSRAFDVGDYHGWGTTPPYHGWAMVPLADLFNHKTGDEDVHFTNIDSDSEADTEEVEIEEPPPSPPALKNGRKRDQDGHVEKDQDKKYRKVRKSTKAKKERCRDDWHPDVQDQEQEKDGNVLIHESGESSKAEVVRNLRRKQTQMVKDEADTEKHKRRRKVKATKNRAEVVEIEDESELEVKDKNRTQRNGTWIARHRKEMVVEVQDSTNDQWIGRRGGKPTELEEQWNSDSTVYQSTRRGRKLEQVEAPENDLVQEESHQTNGQSRQKQTQIEEPRTQLSPKIEDSSEVSSQAGKGNSGVLEMILVKNVAGGSEVFNTYGTLSNAALLHRYGFTELNNPFDIVNIDLSLVVDSFGEAYTSRHMRRRVAKWREVCCSALDSQYAEYFEISATGKPEEGLLMLIYMVHLSDEYFDTLAHMSHSPDGDNKIKRTACLLGWEGPHEDLSAAKKRRIESEGCKKEVDKENKPKVDLETWLLTAPVCRSVLKVLRARNGLYPTETIEADEDVVSATDSSDQPEKFHALRLRISERLILKKCENHVTRQLYLLKEFT